MAFPSQFHYDHLQKMYDILFIEGEEHAPFSEVSKGQANVFQQALGHMRKEDDKWWEIKLSIKPLEKTRHRREGRAFICMKMTMLYQDRNIRGRKSNIPIERAGLRPEVSLEAAEEASRAQVQKWLDQGGYFDEDGVLRLPEQKTRKDSNTAVEEILKKYKGETGKE